MVLGPVSWPAKVHCALRNSKFSRLGGVTLPIAPFCSIPVDMKERKMENIRESKTKNTN